MATYMNHLEPPNMLSKSDREGQFMAEHPGNYFFNPSEVYHPFSGFSQQQQVEGMRFATSFDPLLQDTTFQSAQSSFPAYRSSSTASPVSQHAVPIIANNMEPSMLDMQPWLQDVSEGFKNDPLQLDTQFDFTQSASPFATYSSYQMNSMSPSVDPAFIQQSSTSASMDQMTLPSFVPCVSQPPSLSSSTSDDSSHQWVESHDSHRTTPAIEGSATPPRVLSRNASVQSISSIVSQNSSIANNSTSVDEDGKERTQCPKPDCGKMFKDLKAHLLTHLDVRPEKCPIASCEFHKRGFSRKYDRNRHLTTTHYKATLVCSFCPGEGTAQEVSFNRIVPFKNHFLSTHGVDQNSSASRKRTNRGTPKPSSSSSSASASTPNGETSGRCTTCSKCFATPQTLFDHLDDCILAVVTRPEACEPINERNLRTVFNDTDVHNTMMLHSLPNYSSAHPSVDGDNEECAEEQDNIDTRPSKRHCAVNGDPVSSIHDFHASKIDELKKAHRKGATGVTYSKGGVDLNVAKGRRRKKHYPQSWGCSADDMSLKKRILCVFDGQRRLVKDDMMLPSEFQQRIQLPNGGGYVTDLDIETIRRAEAFHSATEEERGPWIASDFSDPTMVPTGLNNF